MGKKVGIVIPSFNGTEPLFEEDEDPLDSEIIKLYSSLTDENKKYLYGYIQRLLEEQQNH